MWGRVMTSWRDHCLTGEVRMDTVTAGMGDAVTGLLLLLRSTPRSRLSV